MISWTANVYMIRGAHPEIFQGSGGFMELGHFDKHFSKNTKLEIPAGKIFRAFSPRYS